MVPKFGGGFAEKRLHASEDKLCLVVLTFGGKVIACPNACMIVSVMSPGRYPYTPTFSWLSFPAQGQAVSGDENDQNSPILNATVVVVQNHKHQITADNRPFKTRKNTAILVRTGGSFHCSHRAVPLSIAPQLPFLL